MWLKLAGWIRLWQGEPRYSRDHARADAAAEAHALGHFDVKGQVLAFRPEGTLFERVPDFEPREIAAVLDRQRGNTLEAAETLGLPRGTLNDKLRRYGLQ